MSALPMTSVSTGHCPAQWREWWAVESRRRGSDWSGVLAIHASIFQQLCQSRSS
jgi:hypothetical protein